MNVKNFERMYTVWNKKKMTIVLLVAFICQSSFASGVDKDIAELKNEILAIAKSYEGQGDPDQAKQKTIDPLVEKLVALKPMPPVKDRISILAGAWKQVWGPYEYKNNDGSVDPTIGIYEIYQVVFADGYYYNVAPYYPGEDKSKEQVGLLRGEFKLDSTDANGLNVKFTDYPGVDPRPTNTNIWELAALAESGQLQNEITIVPSFIVKLFFGGGKLEEVYTDEDVRILYGTAAKAGSRRSLYVMTRANSSEKVRKQWRRQQKKM